MTDESAADQVLQVVHSEAVGTITLNRPDRGNSLTTELKTALLAALSDVASDEAVRAVVLTATGKAFCAGQDLSEHAAALDRDASTALTTIDEHYNPIVTAIVTMPKPVIAAINGTCVGAGLGLALACDLRIAAAGVRFATAFTGIGLTCDSALSWSLVRAVGASRASQLLLLGEPFSAEQAAAWGILCTVVPADELLAEASTLAARLANGPTLAFAATKRLLAGAVAPPVADALAAELAAQQRLGITDDHRNAVAAFLAKQPPQFSGH